MSKSVDRKKSIFEFDPFRSAALFFLAVALSVPAQRASENASTEVELKSEGVAYLLASGGTIIPYMIGTMLEPRGADASANTTLQNSGAVLYVSGIFIGPSLGQFYAGSYKQGGWAIAGRLGGIILIFPAFVESGSALIDAAAIGGVGLFLGSVIYSFVDTHLAVKRANNKIKARHVGLSPELFPSFSGGLKPGIVAWMKF